MSKAFSISNLKIMGYNHPMGHLLYVQQLRHAVWDEFPCMESQHKSLNQ